jgi:hypothetical protein
MGTAKGPSWNTIANIVQWIGENLQFQGSRLEIEVVLDKRGKGRWQQLGELNLRPPESIDAESIMNSRWEKVVATPYEGHVSVELLGSQTISDVEQGLAGAEYFELTEFHGNMRKGVVTFVANTAQEVTEGLRKLAGRLEDSGYKVIGSCVEAVVGCWRPEPNSEEL